MKWTRDPCASGDALRWWRGKGTPSSGTSCLGCKRRATGRDRFFWDQFSWNWLECAWPIGSQSCGSSQWSESRITQSTQDLWSDAESRNSEPSGHSGRRGLICGGSCSPQPTTELPAFWSPGGLSSSRQRTRGGLCWIEYVRRILLLRSKTRI